jgi:hypothetical protein
MGSMKNTEGPWLVTGAAGFIGAAVCTPPTASSTSAMDSRLP